MPKILLSSGRWGMVERKVYLWRVRKTYLFITLVLKTEVMWLVTRKGTSLINVQRKMGRVSILRCSLWGMQILRQEWVSWHSELKLSFLWFHAFQPIPILWQEWVLVCVCIMECLEIWYKMRKFSVSFKKNNRAYNWSWVMKLPIQWQELAPYPSKCL